MGLAAFCPSAIGPVACYCDSDTGASASLATALGQGIHTVGADGLEWLPSMALAIFIIHPALDFIVLQVLLCIPENPGPVGSHVPGWHSPS